MRNANRNLFPLLIFFHSNFCLFSFPSPPSHIHIHPAIGMGCMCVFHQRVRSNRNPPEDGNERERLITFLSHHETNTHRKSEAKFQSKCILHISLSSLPVVPLHEFVPENTLPWTKRKNWEKIVQSESPVTLKEEGNRWAEFPEKTGNRATKNRLPGHEFPRFTLLCLPLQTLTDTPDEPVTRSFCTYYYESGWYKGKELLCGRRKKRRCNDSSCDALTWQSCTQMADCDCDVLYMDIRWCQIFTSFWCTVRNYLLLLQEQNRPIPIPTTAIRHSRYLIQWIRDLSPVHLTLTPIRNSDDMSKNRTCIR